MRVSLLLHPERKVTPDNEATVLSAAISTLGQVALWEMALSIFHQIPLSKINEVDHMTIMVALCSGGQRALAHQMFKDKAERCLTILDLHNMPVVVAELAVETALDDLTGMLDRPDPSEEVQSLKIITGRGSRSAGEALVRQAVLRMLEARSDVRLQPSQNPGLLTCILEKQPSKAYFPSSGRG